MSLTIKQAFEALSDACANGMKNPFFVMRRLKESFADVASKVVDASGDKVTVTPITDTGTKIAEIKVNNTTSDLYAPKATVTQTVTEGTEIADIDGTKIYAPTGGGGGGGINYSTTEQDTGLKWIDNKTIYQRTYDFGQNYNISNSTAGSFSLDGIATFETIIKCWGIKSDGVFQSDIIITNNNGVADGVAVKNSAASVRYLTVQYTKKTT